MIRTKKTVKKKYATFVKQAGTYLNWTWSMGSGEIQSPKMTYFLSLNNHNIGYSMNRHWQTSLGQTWILDHGMSAGSASESGSSVYNSEGEVNLETLKRYRRKVLAGGWWFGMGYSSQNFPDIQGKNRKLELLLFQI